MTCQERRDLMLLYATDALDVSEATEVRAHLASGCPECTGALAEAEAVVAHLPATLERVYPPADARARLTAKVAGGREARSHEPGMRAGAGTGANAQRFFPLVLTA